MKQFRRLLKDCVLLLLAKFYSLVKKNKRFRGSKVILYHAFGDQTIVDSEIDYGLTIDYQLFFDQINSVPISFFAKSLEDYEQSMRFGGNRLLVSIDDGYTSVRVASDWLSDKNIFHVVFVVSDLVGSDGYLSVGDLISMHSRGFCEIGSHTLDHCNLAKADIVELQRQIRKSKIDIERMLGGARVKCFSLPFGLGGQRAIQQALKAYRYVFTSAHGSNDIDSLLKGIRRVEIVANDTIDRFWLKIRGDHDWIFHLYSFVRRR